MKPVTRSAGPRRPVASLLLILTLVSTGCVGAASPPPDTSVTPPAPSPTVEPGQPTPAAPSPTPSATPAVPDIQLATADLPRAAGSDPDARAAGAAINEFAFDLHRALAGDGGNVVFSPASIAIALGMARAGARADTADQMDQVLRSVASDEHAGWLNSLDQALARRSTILPDDAGNEHELTLDITNASFAQEGFPFEASYLGALASRFGAGQYLVDFMGDPEGARGQVNQWAGERTRGRIPEVLKPGDVKPDTRLALVNAIYLKAPWQRVFQEDQTTNQVFTRADGTDVEVAMMRSPGGARCATAAGWGAMELSYLGGSLSMLVIVPDDLTAFETALDDDVLAGIDRAFEAQFAVPDVSLPRFDIETRTNLAATLERLGMVDAFDPAAADFSGMTTAARLFIGRVIHQANITVDEKGTEAAAVTVVGVDTGGGPSEVCTVAADHPFLFAIRDSETGVILFMGRVVDPSAR